MRRDNVDLVEKPFPVQMVNQTWFASTLSPGEAAFGRIVINLLEAGDVKHTYSQSLFYDLYDCQASWFEQSALTLISKIKMKVDFGAKKGVTSHE